jgi:acyl-CoA reductase-like NAD-dependent aldehyde dehydrogenase
MSYIQIGKEQQARLVTGGRRLTEDSLDGGFFV